MKKKILFVILVILLSVQPVNAILPQAELKLHEAEDYLYNTLDNLHISDKSENFDSVVEETIYEEKTSVGTNLASGYTTVWDPDILREYSYIASDLSTMFTSDNAFNQARIKAADSIYDTVNALEDRLSGSYRSSLQNMISACHNMGESLFLTNWPYTLKKAESGAIGFKSEIYVDGFSEASEKLGNAAKYLEKGYNTEASENFYVALEIVQELDKKYNEINDDLSSDFLYYDEIVLIKNQPVGPSFSDDIEDVGDTIHNFNELLKITYYDKNEDDIDDEYTDLVNNSNDYSEIWDDILNTVNDVFNGISSIFK